MGVHKPFTVLSSYDEMCIAYLDDDGVSREILERNAEKLGEDISPEILEAFGVNEQSPSSQSGSSERFRESKPRAKTEQSVWWVSHRFQGRWRRGL